MSDSVGLDDWGKLIERLDVLVDIETSARTHGAFRRRRQVSSATDLLRLCFGFVVGRLSLRMLAAWAELRGLGCLSDVAVLNRLRGSADWVGHLVSSLLMKRYPEAACGDSSCRRIVAVDATMVTPPGNKADYWIVHTVLDLKELRLSAVEVTDRSQPERLTSGGVRRDEIRIGDRAYARAEELAKLRAAGGEFLVRSPSIYPRLVDHKGGRLERLALCRQAGQQGVLDREVLIASGQTKTTVAARLVILPLPPAAAEKARERARRSGKHNGYKPSPAAIEMAGYLMLLTSLPAQDWPPDKLAATYRQRWQIELAFKRMKSIVGLEGLRARDPDLVRLWINIALLASLLIEDECPALACSEEPDSLPRAA